MIEFLRRLFKIKPQPKSVLTPEKVLKRKPKRWIMNLLFTIAMMAAVAYSFNKATYNEIRLRTFDISFQTMIRQLGMINWDFFFGREPWEFVDGIVFMTIQTLAIAFLGTLLGAILALPFGFLASKNIVGKHVAVFGDFLLTVIRVFPEIILAIILVKGFGMNAFAGLLTIGLHSIGMLGKLFSETIDAMDKSPLEALDAVGATTFDKIRYGIIPQVLPDLTSVALYRLDINVRSASVLGIIGAGGLGTTLLLAGDNWGWDTIGAIMIAIIVMVVTVDIVSSYLRNKLI
ncbi:MAG TPA: phosphonate ABC transporter, permease protein PhnE [Candidatus Izemoplasmatales bacterium]|nr:phosphonate ABC transporter, permease protein PhnE [Bacillota bacterium]HRY77388.1 phosphonate ABC transporter, permease protein PhnE [Candidatus Izemoplasmatales bacterium]